MPIYPSDLDIPPLQLRRADATTVSNYVPAEGEPIWSIDTQKLYIGDGSTVGGIEVSGGGGSSYDQDLNTTSNVKFKSIDIATTSTLRGDVNIGSVTAGYVQGFRSGNLYTNHIRGVQNDLGYNTGISISASTADVNTGSHLILIPEGVGVPGDTKARALITISSNEALAPIYWKFSEDGLQFPDATVQTTAFNVNQDLNTSSNVTFHSLGVYTTGTFSNINTFNMKVNYWADINWVRSSYMRGVTGTSVVIENGSNVGGKITLNTGEGQGVTLAANNETNVATFNTTTSEILSDTFNVKTNSGTQYFSLAPTGITFPDSTVQTTAYTGGGGGTTYDQDLNTTSSVAFTGLKMLADSGTYGHIYGPKGKQSWDTANIEFRAESAVDEVRINAFSTGTGGSSYVWVKSNSVELKVGGYTAALDSNGNFESKTLRAVGGNASTPSIYSVNGNVDADSDGYPEYHYFLQAGCASQDYSETLSKHFRVNNTGTLQIANNANDTVLMSLTDKGVLQTVGIAETVYDLGTGSGTINPDANSGTIFKVTLNGNWTLSSIANAVTGTNVTILVKQDSTGTRTLTTATGWLFAGGAKTLTTTGNAIDMITAFYDGSKYYANLSRGYL